MNNGGATSKESDAPRVIIEVQTSSLAGRRFGFTSKDLKAGVMIGRAPDCNLRFDGARDLKVSGHHALIEERPEGIFVRDQGSSNGLYINRQRVTTEGLRVYDESEISLGQEGAVLKLRIPGDVAPAVSTIINTAAEPPPVETVATEDPAARTLTRMVQDVGREVGAGDKTKKMIKAVAERLEARSARRRANLVTLTGALFMALVAAGAIGVWHYVQNEEIEAQEDERVKAEIEKDIDEKLRKSLADVTEDLRKEQAGRFEDLKKDLDTATVDRIREIADEHYKSIQDANEEERGKWEELYRAPDEGNFAELAEKYNESVFLIFVQYPLIDANGKAVGVESGTGTGWLAKTAEGKAWVVTNKHVLKPFLFKPELAVSHAIRNVKPAPMDRWVIAAWQPGSKFRDHVGDNDLSVAEAWATLPGAKGGNGRLDVTGFAPDDWTTFGDNYATYLERAGFKTNLPTDVIARVKKAGVHAMDSFNDLAVLEFERADATQLAAPLPIASQLELNDLRQMERVMSLGYPLGLNVIKGTTVTTSPATGDIRSLQFEVGVIGTSAPILPGNSGGPLISDDGKVIGVITRRFEGTQGEAISADHVRKLVDKLAK